MATEITASMISTLKELLDIDWAYVDRPRTETASERTTPAVGPSPCSDTLSLEKPVIET
jgi:hypothetical protein